MIGYYLFKAYNANKEKQEETYIPENSETNPAPRKKKSIFDEFLEEIEKAQQAQQAPQTVPTAPAPAVMKKPKEVKNIVETPHVELASRLEGQRSTSDTIPIEEIDTKKSSKRGFAGMNMSPKEALKAQIILERKF